MKKFFTLIMSICLLLSTTAFAYELPAPNSYEITGYVLEVLPDGFKIQATDGRHIVANVTDKTHWDGLYADRALVAGDFVIIGYNGAMTRSIPMQIHADRVSCFLLEGKVTEILDATSILLTEVPTYGEVIVHVQTDASVLPVGLSLRVLYNGVMAMSLPGQISAHVLLIPQSLPTP